MKSFTFFKFLSKGDKTLFDVPVKKQLAFIHKLGAPRDDIERSYFQYLSQQEFVAVWKKVLLNLCSVLLIPIIIPFLLVKGVYIKQADRIDAIGEFKGLEDLVPLCLSESYKINNEVWREGFSLRYTDLHFLFSSFRLFNPYFVLKSLIKIAQYSHSFALHQPRAVLVHNEYSFTSSILTAYCNYFNVKHINLMHGEKLLYIRDSFFRYDECYVWDIHYVKLFIEMQAEPSQFRIAVPPSMLIDTQKYYNKEINVDYKYYLANNTEEEIANVANILRRFKSKGKSIKVRLHPRYSDLNVVKRYFSEHEIENPKSVGIKESISNADYIIGSYSTVLVQAYLAGKNVVMDDLTFKKQFEKLMDMKYILSQKMNIKLSEL